MPENECLAVVWALSTLDPYLMGVHLTIYTAQSPLSWFISISYPSGRPTRWRVGLAKYDFQVIYEKDAQNTEAHALLRLPKNGEVLLSEGDDIPSFIAEERNDVECKFEERPEDWDENADFDSLLSTRQTPENSIQGIVLPLSPEELTREQFGNPSCVRIRRRPYRGDDLPLEVNDKGYIARLVEARPHIVVPHSMHSRVLQHWHHARLGCQQGGGSSTSPCECLFTGWPWRLNAKQRCSFVPNAERIR